MAHEFEKLTRSGLAKLKKSELVDALLVLRAGTKNEDVEPGETVSSGAQSKIRAAQKAAAAAEARMIDAIENVSEGFVLFDENDCIVLCNSQYKDIYGYSEEDVTPGTTLASLIERDLERGGIPSSDPEIVAALHRRTEHYGETDETLDVPLADGRWVQIRDRRTAYGGTVSIHADVTDRKRAEQAQQIILESIPIPVSVARLEDGVFLYCNEPWARISGRSSEEMVGTLAIDRYWNKEDRTRFLELLRRDGQVDEFEVQIKDSDDAPFWALVSSRRIVFEGQHATLTTLTDISKQKMAEEASRAGEARFLSILQSSPIAVGISIERRFTFINDRFSELFGWDPDNLENEDGTSIFQDKEQRFEIRREIEEIGFITDREVVFENARGETYPCLFSAFQTTYEGKQAVIGWVYDVSELKTAQEEIDRSREILETTINSVNQGIVMIDGDHRIVAANNRYAELTWLDPEFLDSNPSWVDMMRKAGEAGWFGPDVNLDEMIPRQLDIRSTSFEPTIHQHARSDGTEFEFWSKALSDGGWVQSVTDVTERLESEKILKEAKEEAEAAADAKSEFVAIVSHEVRTPMNGVLGMVRLLQETELDGQQREYADTILQSGESLLVILNDLLDISKLDAGKLEMEIIPFSPTRLVDQTIALMSARALEKGLNLSSNVGPNVPAVLNGDPNRIRQILFNLISNAVKFTDEGHVFVGLTAVENADGQSVCTLAVSDSGVGISDEAKDTLFSEYSQGAISVARKYGGTGLGLTICRRLAEIMGGEIVLDSTLGEGSTFSLIVPLEPAEGEMCLIDEMDDVLPEISERRALRILLVEDNEINRKVATGMVENLGHQVAQAEHGQEALDILTSDDGFDAVLMDRHMPVMDGLEATRRIRTIESDLAGIPIIALTAAVTKQEVEACLRAGMNEVVSKPVNPIDLSRALANVPKRAARAGDARSRDDGSEGMQSNGGSQLPPVFDPAVMKTMRTDFGDVVMDRLIEDFRKIAGETVTAFIAAAESLDAEIMTRSSHDLKSNGATLGFKRLSGHARTVELACVEGRLDEAAVLGQSLPALFAEAMAVLDAEEPGDPEADDDALTAFLSGMAHDIRNNLNVVLGYARLFQDHPDAALTADELDEYALEIQKKSTELGEMAVSIKKFNRDLSGQQ